MNIIVTGGAGFIGSNFVFHMLKKYPDYRIICLDKLTYAGNLSTLAPVMDNPNFRFVKADICDCEAVNKLFEEEHPDIVVNFAAESHVDRSIEDPGIFLQTNIIGTSVLMDACRKYGIQRYHQVSTDEVYGDLPLDRPDLFFTEETPIHTSSPYSSSKAAADLLVLAYHRTYGLPVTISRCSNNYGFLVLSDEAEFCYKVNDFWHPNDEGGMAWNDPEIGIEWPELKGEYKGSASAEGYTLEDGTALNLSDKDQKWLGLKDTFKF